MIFAGIDPGKHGAIAWMDGDRRNIQIQDCPLDGEDFDRGAVLYLLQHELQSNTVVTMEKVHSMPHDGRVSAFAFGRAYEMWIMGLAAVGLRPQLVCPQTWKRTMLAGVANNPAMEGKILIQRFQDRNIASLLYGPRGGLRDGRVDAMWLAEYGRVHWKLAGRKAA